MSADPPQVRGASVLADALLITLVWTVAVALAGPPADFPLNDDWSYSVTVERLLEEGRYDPVGWTAMTLVTHVLWGALFCVPTGFSFTALKVSSLVAALVGSWAVYLLVLQLRRPRWLAVAAALTVGLNAVYFALSYTFMTDVSFAAGTTLSAVCFAKSLRDGARGWAAAAMLLALIAILCRHIGLYLPVAYAVTLLAGRGLRAAVLWKAAAGFVLAAGVLGAFFAWLVAAGKAHSGFVAAVTSIQIPRVSLFEMLTQALSIPLYLGLFLLPVLLLFVPRSGVETARVPRQLGGAFVLLAGIGLAVTGRTMPLMRLVSEGNVLVPGGIGPLTLRDEFFLHTDHWTPLPHWFWVAVTVGAVAGGGLLVSRLSTVAACVLRRGESDRGQADPVSFFFFVAFVLYCIPVTLVPGTFDRYLLPLLPLACGAFAACRGEIGVAVDAKRVCSAFVLLLTFAVFSVAGTRDYLTWNRARWQALERLEQDEGVSPARIDGGFEFNGLRLYSPSYEGDGGKSWWWVEDDEYVLSFGPIAGYDTHRSVEFARWLPPGVGRIQVQRRSAAAETEGD